MFTKSGLFTILKVTKSGFDCTMVEIEHKTAVFWFEWNSTVP